jgi:HEAT repeat protein
MRLIRSSVLAVSATMWGCGPGGGAQPVARPPGATVVERADGHGGTPPRGKLVTRRDPDESGEVDRTPRVSDDPREIDEVRKLGKREQDALYAAALKRLGGSDVLVSRYRRALEGRKPRAVADLRRIMGGRKASDEYRARAALALIELGEPSGEAYILDAVRTGRGMRRFIALQKLEESDIGRKMDLASPERARSILACLDDADPEVVHAAASLCAKRKVPGTEEKLVALIQRGGVRDPSRLVVELAEVARSPEAVRIIRTEMLRDPSPQPDPWNSYTLRHLLGNPDPKVSEPIRSALLVHILAGRGKQRYDQVVARELVDVADRTTLPVLEEYIAHSRDPIARSYAVEALARIDPEHALDRALELARVEKHFDLVTPALARLASERNADRIIDAFLEDHKRARHVRSREARLLVERLGPRGREVAAEFLDDMNPEARAWVTWRLKGLSLGSAIDDLRAAGIIKMSRETILDAMRRDIEADDSLVAIDPSDPRRLSNAMACAGVLTRFDAETGEVSSAHHLLVMDLAANSGGAFDPECAMQTRPREGRGENRGPYTVRFLYKGRLYRFVAADHVDWYDVAAVHRALNFALETAGQKERFIALDTGDQSASFVCADPDAFRPIAAKYGLVLSKDPGAAERRGKAFERQAIEQIKKLQRP